MVWKIEDSHDIENIPSGQRPSCYAKQEKNLRPAMSGRLLRKAGVRPCR